MNMQYELTVALSPSIPSIAEAEGGKHELWAGQFSTHGAYTIFHHTRAGKTTFAFMSQDEK